MGTHAMAVYVGAGSRGLALGCSHLGLTFGVSWVLTKVPGLPASEDFWGRVSGAEFWRCRRLILWGLLWVKLRSKAGSLRGVPGAHREGVAVEISRIIP